MNKNEKTIGGIGGVTFIRKKGLKRITIKLKPFEGIVVNYPYALNIQRAEHFVISKTTWINKNLERIKELEKNRKIFSEGPFTRFHQIIFRPQNRTDYAARIKDNQVIVSFPKETAIDAAELQSFIRNLYEKTLRREAKTVLPDMVERLSAYHDLRYNKLYFKNQKSRWGSCSTKNNINLNIHLMRLPERLMEYVILHELAHTLHKNHGKEFWRTLEKFYPEYKKAKKELSHYSPLYY